MRTPLQTLLPDIRDPDIRELIDDLCEMLLWREEQFPEYTLRNFLESVFRDDPERVSLSRIAVPRVVDRKLGELHDHATYAVCRELKNGDGLEMEAGKRLFTFLEAYFRKQRNPLPKRRRR